MELEDDAIIHSEKNWEPYNIKSLKKLPLNIRINKLIDIVDFIQNKGFFASNIGYYNELNQIIQEDK